MSDVDDEGDCDLSKPATLKDPYKSLESIQFDQRSKASVSEAHLVENKKTKERFIRLFNRYRKPYKKNVEVGRGFNIYKGDSLSKLIDLIRKFAEVLGWKQDVISEVELDKQAEQISQILESKDKEISDLRSQLAHADADKNNFIEEIKRKHENEIKLLKQDTEQLKKLDSDLLAFKSLIANFANEKKTEEDIQKFLDGKKWFFGTNVVAAKPKTRAGSSNVFDFLLTYTNGSQKVLELKLPTEPLLDSEGRITASVAKSLDQLIDYLTQTVSIAHSALPEAEYITEKKPRGILVIGCSKNDQTIEKLKSWNYALHLVEIKTYDDLIADAETSLKQLKDNNTFTSS